MMRKVTCVSIKKKDQNPRITQTLEFILLPLRFQRQWTSDLIIAFAHVWIEFFF